MKKVLLSLAAVAAVAGAAAPAAAQSYGYDRDYRYDRYDNYDRDYRGGRADRGDNLEWRIERGLRNGSLTPREAARLRADVRSVEQLSWRYRRDGRVTQWEREDLNRRYSMISARLRYERNDREYGYGYGPGYRR